MMLIWACSFWIAPHPEIKTSRRLYFYVNSITIFLQTVFVDTATNRITMHCINEPVVLASFHRIIKYISSVNCSLQLEFST
jgi:hypothetical protein